MGKQIVLVVFGMFHIVIVGAGLDKEMEISSVGGNRGR